MTNVKKTLVHQLFELINHAQYEAPDKAIAKFAELSNRTSSELWLDVLNDIPNLTGIQKNITDIYYKYILNMEENEVAYLLKCPDIESKFSDIASPEALTAYFRVTDLFSELDIKGYQHVVMVGCGQLPVTALHIIEKTPVQKVTCLDISETAINTIIQLKKKFGWNGLNPQLYDGAEYDYSNADIIYIANMVNSKSNVLRRVIKSSRNYPQIVIREPYSLGNLWSESCMNDIQNPLYIKSVGPGSKYLSRDVFLGWQL